MSVRSINAASGTAGLRAATPTSVDIGYDIDDNKIKFKDDAAVVKKVMSEGDAGQSIVSPAVTGNATTGVVVSKSVRLVEAAAATSYTATIPIPAGAVVQSIRLIAEVLWNGTSATAKVGDTADDDGFFTGVNLKATDLLVNEILDVVESSLWGGKEGAYLVAASGRRGPTTTNFGLYYAAGSNITCIVTPGAADGTAGRTVFSVTYSVGEVIAPVVV